MVDNGQRQAWDVWLAAYLGFLSAQGRSPSAYSQDPLERSLSQWLSRQRTTLGNGLMVPSRAEALDLHLPGWRTAHRIRPDWDEVLGRVVEFRDIHGRFPSSSASGRDEWFLGCWLHRQRSDRARQDRRHASRVASLDRELPGWRGNPNALSENWARQLNLLAEHLQRHQRLPGMGGTRPEAERRIANWMYAQRTALKKGRLHPDRARLLEEQAPGWRGALNLEHNDASGQQAFSNKLSAKNTDGTRQDLPLSPEGMQNG